MCLKPLFLFSAFKPFKQVSAETRGETRQKQQRHTKRRSHKHISGETRQQGKTKCGSHRQISGE